MVHIDRRALSYMGCSCHNSAQARRTVRRAAKLSEERQWQADAAYELTPDEYEDQAPEPAAPRDDGQVSRHVYTTNRCMFCGTDEIDDTVYGPFECEAREPLRHTSGP